MPARPSRLTALTAFTAVLLTLAACSGPPTPHVFQPNPQDTQDTQDAPSGQPSGAASPGQTPAPGTTATTPATPPSLTNTPNPEAPPPANSAPPSNVPAELVGTWQATVSGARMTKVLRADATYSETWADAAAPCQASGTLQVNGGTLTLNPSTTSCTWRVVVYQFTFDGATLILTSNGLAQDYTRA